MDLAQANAHADSLLSGAIEALNTPITIPTKPGISTAAVKVELKRASTTREETKQTLATERARAASAIEQEKIGIDAEAQAGRNKIAADQARSQQEANNYVFFANALGLDADPSSEIAQSIIALRRGRAALEPKLREIQEMQSVGPLDNPLEWLFNTIQLPSKIANYNREADTVELLDNTVQTGIKTAQDAGNLANKGIPTITVAQASASADKVSADAIRLKAAADKALAASNVDFATKKLAQDLAIANATRETSQLDLQNSQIQWSADIAAIQLADTRANRQLRAAEVLEKLQKTKGLDLIFESYDIIMGYPPGTTSRVSFDRIPKAHQENIIAIGNGSFGVGPFDALVNFSNGRPGPLLSEDTRKWFNYLQDKMTELSTNPTTTRKLTLMPKESQVKYIDDRMKEIISTELTSAHKQTSLFHELEPSKMILANAIDPKSKLAEVIEPLAKVTGPIPTNLVVSTIAEAYKDPAISGQVIAEYYRRNIFLRNSAFSAAGASGIKLDTTYKIPVGVFRETSLDLTNTADATKYVLILQTKSIVDKLKGAAVLTMPGGVLQTLGPAIKPEISKVFESVGFGAPEK